MHTEQHAAPTYTSPFSLNKEVCNSREHGGFMKGGAKSENSQNLGKCKCESLSHSLLHLNSGIYLLKKKMSLKFCTEILTAVEKRKSVSTFQQQYRL